MALANIVGALGLAGAAGLNAYIPLLIVALLARANAIRLSEPFDVLASIPAILAIVVLGVIEFIADKLPGVDHINDAVQTLIRPAAGAILFAANTGVITEIDPTLALICGLVLALSVHSAKAAARPVVNATTMGVGAPVVSLLEDGASAALSLVSVFAWPLAIALLVVLVLLGTHQIRRLRARKA
ncbi:MAG: DUF4126 domain-containing protein [Thermoflexales bacterium]